MIGVLKHINPRLVALSILLLVANYCFSQQAPHYAQYLYNMQVINPAFVGSKSDFNATLLTRQQWINVEGAPETTTFSVNTRINSGFGFGATVISDKIGLVNNTSVNGDLSYTIATSEYGRLAFGVKAGLAFFNSDLASGVTVDNEVYASRTGTYSNLGFGFLYTNEYFFVALSVPNIFTTPVFRLQNDLQTVTDLENGNYFFSGGAIIKLSKFNDIVFKPSTLIKYTPSLPVSVDLNANFIYNKTYEAGLSYRYSNSISAMFALTLNEKLRIGYAYENQLNSIGNNFNTHELILRIDLKLNRNKRWLYEDCCYF